MIGSNVNELRKWEGYQWCYSKSFVAPQLKPGQQYQLFFAGIDCLADIWLNGKHIGKAENMMIEHAFNVTKEIKAGESNQLQVILRSSVIEGQKTSVRDIQYWKTSRLKNPYSSEKLRTPMDGTFCHD